MSIQKNSWSYPVSGLAAPVGVTRWGHYGLPLVLFASAGGDCLEAERLQLIAALAGLIESGRIKVFAVDGTAVQMLLAGTATSVERLQGLMAFDEWVGTTLVAQVREDCQSATVELLACGCAFGAASALQALVRHPALFRGAIGLSGSYDLAPWIGPVNGVERASPVTAIAELPDDEALARLRQRTVVLACTAGDYEEPAATTRMAAALRERGVNPREDIWRRSGMNFGFASWREMLPRFVSQWV